MFQDAKLSPVNNLPVPGTRLGQAWDKTPDIEKDWLTILS